MGAILLLVITLVGITYAYFVAKVQGNDNNKSVAGYDIYIEDVINELTLYEDLTNVLECTSSIKNECKGSEGFFLKLIKL